MTVRGRRDFRRFHRILIVSRLLLARSISISVLLGLLRLSVLIESKVVHEGFRQRFLGSLPTPPLDDCEYGARNQKDDGCPGGSVIHCRRQRRCPRIRHLLRRFLPRTHDECDVEDGEFGCSEHARCSQSATVQCRSQSCGQSAGQDSDRNHGQSSSGYNFLLLEKILRCSLSKPRPQAE